MTEKYCDQNGEIVTRAALKALVSPASLPRGDLTGLGWAGKTYAKVVEETPPPTTEDEKITRVEAAEFVDGEWVQKWAKQVLTPEEKTKREEDARLGMTIERWQFRAALIQKHLLPTVEGIVVGLDPVLKEAWANAPRIRRTGPLVQAVQAQAKWTDAQVDRFFTDAASLEA